MLCVDNITTPMCLLLLLLLMLLHSSYFGCCVFFGSIRPRLCFLYFWLLPSTFAGYFDLASSGCSTLASSGCIPPASKIALHHLCQSPPSFATPPAVYAPFRTALTRVEFRAGHHLTVLPTTSQPLSVLLPGTKNRLTTLPRWWQYSLHPSFRSCHHLFSRSRHPLIESAIQPPVVPTLTTISPSFRQSLSSSMLSMPTQYRVSG